MSVFGRRKASAKRSYFFSFLFFVFDLPRLEVPNLRWKCRSYMDKLTDNNVRSYQINIVISAAMDKKK